MCSKLYMNKDNKNFIDFLSSDAGSQIPRENKLSIHIETGNICYENDNKNESVYDFLLWQQDETKKILHATLTCKNSFSNFLGYLWTISMLKLWTNLTFLQTKTVNTFFTNLTTNFCLTGKALSRSGTLKS